MKLALKARHALPMVGIVLFLSLVTCIITFNVAGGIKSIKSPILDDRELTFGILPPLSGMHR